MLTRDVVLLLLEGIFVLGVSLLDSNRCKFPGGKGLRCITWARKASFSCSIDLWKISSSELGVSVYASVVACVFVFCRGRCLLLKDDILSLFLLPYDWYHVLPRGWYSCLLLLGRTKEGVESMIILSALSRRSNVLRASIEILVH